jgi:hypothetical protein
LQYGYNSSSLGKLFITQKCKPWIFRYFYFFYSAVFAAFNNPASSQKWLTPLFGKTMCLEDSSFLGSRVGATSMSDVRRQTDDGFTLKNGS